MSKDLVSQKSSWLPPSHQLQSSLKAASSDSIQPKTGEFKPSGKSSGWQEPAMSGVSNHFLRQSLQAKGESQSNASSPTIQTKLTLGEAGDKYEQEADATAAKVVERINSPATQSPVQQQVEPVAQPTLMRAGAGAGGAIDPGVEQGIERARGGGEEKGKEVKEPMEEAFGSDFSGVRIHTNEKADMLNRSLQSRAFTTGQDIFFKRGEYNPGHQEGQELMAHELTHVEPSREERERPVQRMVQNPATTTTDEKNEHEEEIAKTIDKTLRIDGLNLAGEDHEEMDNYGRERKYLGRIIKKRYASTLVDKCELTMKEERPFYRKKLLFMKEKVAMRQVWGDSRWLRFLGQIPELIYQEKIHREQRAYWYDEQGFAEGVGWGSQDIGYIKNLESATDAYHAILTGALKNYENKTYEPKISYYKGRKTKTTENSITQLVGVLNRQEVTMNNLSVTIRELRESLESWEKAKVADDATKVKSHLAVTIKLAEAINTMTTDRETLAEEGQTLTESCVGVRNGYWKEVNNYKGKRKKMTLSTADYEEEPEEENKGKRAEDNASSGYTKEDKAHMEMVARERSYHMLTFLATMKPSAKETVMWRVGDFHIQDIQREYKVKDDVKIGKVHIKLIRWSALKELMKKLNSKPIQ